MKKVFCLFALLLILLCGCSNGVVFTQTANGNLVSNLGMEYSHLANEGVLYYFGDLEFIGSVKGEKKISKHLGISYQTGLFAIKNPETDNILIRRVPNNEWFSIYRKSTFPSFDYSVDNCIRLELVLGTGNTENDAIHTTCGDGISNKSEIAEFLTDVRSQKNPKDAGLYDLVRKPDGMLENCYTYAVIYGFFEEEPNLAIRIDVTSYNDLAYSVCIENKEYVLPNDWVQRLN